MYVPRTRRLSNYISDILQLRKSEINKLSNLSYTFIVPPKPVYLRLQLLRLQLPRAVFRCSYRPDIHGDREFNYKERMPNTYALPVLVPAVLAERPADTTVQRISQQK